MNLLPVICIPLEYLPLTPTPDPNPSIRQQYNKMEISLPINFKHLCRETPAWPLKLQFFLNLLFLRKKVPAATYFSETKPL